VWKVNENATKDSSICSLISYMMGTEVSTFINFSNPLGRETGSGNN